MGYDVSNLFHNVFNMISFVADLKVPDSFEDGLARLHQLELVDMPRDGNCLFHAVSHQLSLRGNNINHAELRKSTVKYMKTLKRVSYGTIVKI